MIQSALDKKSVASMGHLLTEREAAEVLGCSVALLRKQRREGGGPTYCKIGSLVRYSDTDIMAYIDQSRVEAA